MALPFVCGRAASAGFRESKAASLSLSFFLRSFFSSFFFFLELEEEFEFATEEWSFLLLPALAPSVSTPTSRSEPPRYPRRFHNFSLQLGAN